MRATNFFRCSIYSRAYYRFVRCARPVGPRPPCKYIAVALMAAIWKNGDCRCDKHSDGAMSVSLYFKPILSFKVVVVMNKERSFGKWRKGVGGLASPHNRKAAFCLCALLLSFAPLTSLHTNTVPPESFACILLPDRHIPITIRRTTSYLIWLTLHSSPA